MSISSEVCCHVECRRGSSLSGCTRPVIATLPGYAPSLPIAVASRHCRQGCSVLSSARPRSGTTLKCISGIMRWPARGRSCGLELEKNLREVYVSQSQIWSLSISAFTFETLLRHYAKWAKLQIEIAKLINK